MKIFHKQKFIYKDIEIMAGYTFFGKFRYKILSDPGYVEYVICKSNLKIETKP